MSASNAIQLLFYYDRFDCISILKFFTHKGWEIRALVADIESGDWRSIEVQDLEDESIAEYITLKEKKQSDMGFRMQNRNGNYCSLIFNKECASMEVLPDADEPRLELFSRMLDFGYWQRELLYVLSDMALDIKELKFEYY